MLQAVASFPQMAQASSSIGFKEDAAQLAPECRMARRQGQVWLGRMACRQKGE